MLQLGILYQVLNIIQKGNFYYLNMVQQTIHNKQISSLYELYLLTEAFVWGDNWIKSRQVNNAKNLWLLLSLLVPLILSVTSYYRKVWQSLRKIYVLHLILHFFFLIVFKLTMFTNIFTINNHFLRVIIIIISIHLTYQQDIKSIKIQIELLQHKFSLFQEVFENILVLKLVQYLEEVIIIYATLIFIILVKFCTINFALILQRQLVVHYYQ
eukprot:TRINITY_DN1851_c0_g1_i25.p2 TRINITY_DN1851_c0_g1~~TRINITY_DN1851_c0_g1_i25.p2  ORF type:complete len:212 (+),score=-18.56 TRINITY_DN1851_c0_g1_i25:1602-2237(+)